MTGNMKKLAYILSLFLLFSCGEEKAEKPKNLLPENKIVDILYDIAVLQAISSYQPKALDSSRVDAKNYIFKKYKTDSLTFTQSHEYYALDLKKYEGIQKKVAARIDQDMVKEGVKKKEVSGGIKDKNGALTPRIRKRSKTTKPADKALQVPSGKASSQ